MKAHNASRMPSCFQVLTCNSDGIISITDVGELAGMVLGSLFGCGMYTGRNVEGGTAMSLKLTMPSTSEQILQILPLPL